MGRIYDNWERVVKATLKREEFRELARAESVSTVSSGISSIHSFNSPLHRSMSNKFSGPQEILDSQGSGTTSTRNFQIQPSRFWYKGVVSLDYGDKTWKILERAINQIYMKDSNIATFEELYRNAYNMVFHNFGEKLYSGLVTTITFHLQLMCKSIEAAPFALFLEELNTKWTFHNHAVSNIREMLVYAERTFILSTRRTPILELGLNLWRDNVIHSTKIQALLPSTLLELIFRERSGEVVNRALMQSTIKMLMDLGPSVYQDYFEKPFLEASAEFYRAESQENIERSDFGDYLKKVDRHLVEEKKRASNYLDPKTEAKITNVVEKEMIANHMHRLLSMENLGLVKMLVDDNYEDLGRMCSLFSRCPNGLFTIRDIITSHIRSTGEQLVTDPEKLKDPVKFVNTLLEERYKYDNNEAISKESLSSSKATYLVEILDSQGSGTTSTRNFQIQPSRFWYKGVVSLDYGDKTWKILERAINQIYMEDNNIATFEELYRNAYNMVFHNFGEKLYSGLVTTITFHLQLMCESIEAAPFALFLEELNTKWTFHNHAVSNIREMLVYAERTFILSTHKTPILELGLNLWRDNVIHSTKIQALLPRTLLELIFRERSGEVVNRALMQSTIKMLMDLGPSVYQDYFEKPFLEASAEFYRAESQENIERSDFGDYLKKVDRHLVEEKKRASNYLDPKTEAKITNVVEKEMIANHMLRLLSMENSGLVKMLVDDNYEELGRMCSLFSRCPNGLFTIGDIITSHIRSTGEQLVTDPEKLKDPVKFVNTLLEERYKYDKIISLVFNNEDDFHDALNSSFEYFINLDPRMAEYISLFVDDKLCKGLGDKKEDSEIILDKVKMLLRYLQEKDLFVKYYNQHLAKRLLSGISIFDDAEMRLLNVLKAYL